MKNKWKIKLQQLRRHTAAIFGAHKLGLALNVLETFLTDEQLSRLQRASDMRGAPISTVIRIAVADYLKNMPRSLTLRRTLFE
jgi:hypothetical protein